MQKQDQTLIQSNQNAKGRFGTFGGVFVPNVLTILGLVYFLLIGKVVGSVGLTLALIIVLLANLISFLTGLSLSAVSTSMQVRTGGAYYILARTLGLEIGGAIGIPLYLSQAISVAFYIIGFTTALNEFVLIPNGIIEAGAVFLTIPVTTWIALIVGGLFAVLAYFGADFAIKIQYIVLVALMAAIASFFFGGWESIQDPVWGDPTDSLLKAGVERSEILGFWATFAFFFPAVTGITVGASMSGDLKNPGKAIPWGTMTSIIFTSIIYVASTIWIAMHAAPPELLGDTTLMQKIAAWPHLHLIVIGVFAATLSSALGSVLAAPRTLQALAMDNVVPRFLASQMGSKTEPRAAVITTAIIMAAFLMMGELTQVASLLTLFFLNTYGMINLAAGIEKLVGNPSYRPKFKVHWLLSLIGGFGCYGAMFLIDAPLTMVAIAVSFGFFIYLERRSLKSDWGDVRSGIWFTLARGALLKLEAQTLHPKNWRPNILVFSGRPHVREHLVECGRWLSRGRGIVTYVQMLIGEWEQMAALGLRTTAQNLMKKYIEEENILAFSQVEAAEDFNKGVLHIAQAHGMAGLEPNAAIFGWSKEHKDRVSQADLMRKLALLGKSVMLMRYNEEKGFGERKQIDVWWGGRDRNAEMMLLLSHIISQHRSWSGSKIRLCQVINDPQDEKATLAHIKQTLEEVRVRAKPLVILRENPQQGINALMREHSADADLIMIGMQLPEPDDYAVHADRIDVSTRGLNSVLMVRSAEVLDLLDVEKTQNKA